MLWAPPVGLFTRRLQIRYTTSLLESFALTALSLQAVKIERPDCLGLAGQAKVTVQRRPVPNVRKLKMTTNALSNA